MGSEAAGSPAAAGFAELKTCVITGLSIQHPKVCCQVGVEGSHPRYKVADQL